MDLETLLLSLWVPSILFLFGFSQFACCLHSFYFLIICFYFWLCWVFVAVRGLSLIAASKGYSSLRCAAYCRGFSCCRAQALGTWASVVVARRLSSCGSRALEHRLSSCGTQALLLRGMWDLPGPGLEPVSPALAGRFLTTAPPGKPTASILQWLPTFLGRKGAALPTSFYLSSNIFLFSP